MSPTLRHCNPARVRCLPDPASSDRLQDTAGDDRLANTLHQGLDHEEGSLSQTAPTGCAPLLPRKDRQGLITETPRGIVAKLVVDRIIAEL